MADPHPFWSYVPPAILSALISAAVAYYTSKATIRRSEWNSRVDDAVKAIDIHREDVMAYWGKPQTSDELAYLAVSIKGQFHDISEQITDLKLLKAPFNSNYIDRLLDDVFDASTGGDFDSPTRSLNLVRAGDAGDKIAELRREIIRCRRRSQ